MNTKRAVKTGLMGCGLLLLLAGVCRANPVTLDELIFPRGLRALLCIIMIDSGVDTLALLIGYAIVRRVEWFMSSEIVKYLICVIGMGFVVDGVVQAAGGWFGVDPWSFSIRLMLLALVLLAAINSALCKLFCDLTSRRAIIVGLTMGVFTNPLLFTLMLESRFMDDLLWWW